MYELPQDSQLYKSPDGFYRLKIKHEGKYKKINNEQKLNNYRQTLYAIQNLITVPSLLSKFNEDLKTEDERKHVIASLASDGLREVNDEIARVLKVTPYFVNTPYFNGLCQVMRDYQSIICIASD